MASNIRSNFPLKQDDALCKCYDGFYCDDAHPILHDSLCYATSDQDCASMSEICSGAKPCTPECPCPGVAMAKYEVCPATGAPTSPAPTRSIEDLCVETCDGRCHETIDELCGVHRFGAETSVCRCFDGYHCNTDFPIFHDGMPTHMPMHMSERMSIRHVHEQACATAPSRTPTRAKTEPPSASASPRAVPGCHN